MLSILDVVKIQENTYVRIANVHSAGNLYYYSRSLTRGPRVSV